MDSTMGTGVARQPGERCFCVAGVASTHGGFAVEALRIALGAVRWLAWLGGRGRGRGEVLRGAGYCGLDESGINARETGGTACTGCYLWRGVNTAPEEAGGGVASEGYL